MFANAFSILRTMFWASTNWINPGSNEECNNFEHLKGPKYSFVFKRKKGVVLLCVERGFVHYSRGCAFIRNEECTHNFDLELS